MKEPPPIPKNKPLPFCQKRPKLKTKKNYENLLTTVLLIQALGLLTICKAVVMMLIYFNGIEM